MNKNKVKLGFHAPFHWWLSEYRILISLSVDNDLFLSITAPVFTDQRLRMGVVIRNVHL